MLTMDWTRLRQAAAAYVPAPARPDLWQGQQLYHAQLGSVRVTVHGHDSAEALAKITAIALEYGLCH